MLEIMTTSHTIATRHNKIVFGQLTKIINEYAIHHKSEVARLFSEERIWLDDCNGFVSFVSNNDGTHLTMRQAKLVRDFIKSKVRYSGDIFIDCYTFSINLKH